MGKLAMYGALGGIGKGLEQEYLLEEKATQAEAKDSRTYQLERLRQRGAMDRQNVQDKSAQDRQTEKLAADKELLTSRLTQEETGAVSQQAHEIVIQGMKEKTALAKEQRKYTREEMEDRFSHSETKASTTIDPATGQWVSTPAASRWKDSLSGTVYLQRPMDPSVEKGTVMFVPEGIEQPTPARQAAGQRAIKEFLINIPKGLEDERMFKFLGAFHFLPPEFFAQTQRASRAGKLTEATTIKETLTQPAAQ